MFKPIQLHKSITFIVGLLFGCSVTSIVVLGIVYLLDTKADDNATNKVLDKLADIVESSDSDDDLNASFEEFLDTNNTATQSESRFNRKTTLYSMLVRSDYGQLLKLLSRSSFIPNSTWRMEIQSAIFRRLTTIDPDKALDLVRKLSIEQRPKLIESVFQEWSFLNLEGAVGAGTRLDFPNREIALKAIMQTRVDLSEDEQVEIGQRFGYEKYVERLFDVTWAMELIDNPRRAWIALIDDGLDVRFRLNSVVDIAQTWVRQDGSGVLREMFETDDGMVGLSALNLLIVRSLARANPEEFFRQVAAEPDSRSLRAEIVGVWAETDPVAALSGVSSLVEVSERPLMTREILRTWSETNPLELLNERTILPESMEIQALSYAIRAIAKKDPREAIRLMEKLRTEGVNTWPVAEVLIYTWSENDPRATLDWVMSGSNDDNPQFGRLVQISLTNLARVDPERALVLALNPPSSTWPTGLDSDVIHEIARKDVDAAAKLLPRVSEESRTRAYISVGSGYIEQGHPDRALALARQLRPSDRERDYYYLSTFDTWASTDPHQLLEAIEDIPSGKPRAIAARSLIDRNKERHFFSEAEVKRVKTYLNEEDAE
ncbi:MAG: hypothetical protein F4Z01_04350 [Gammaproteobacteria bacterium]|nr:hypothetical protein [Gammaproteobacteria bacterium]MYF37205.1 hypothetical protein [Gammaproteobacteria bacterium]